MDFKPETSTSNTCSISLCICTMNRPDDLDRCLESVFQATGRPDEVIVSDDSPDGQLTQAVAAKYPEALYQPGPRRGLGPNRNACIRKAQGNYLIFIDDDVCVPPDFFTTARQLIAAADPQTIITGYEMNYGGGGRWQGEARKVTPANPDFWGLQRLPVKQEYRGININSTIFPRSLFEQAHFDENLRYGSEEMDITLHAVALGYRIAYEDRLYVNHYPSPVNREHYQRFVHASRLYAMTKAYWQYEGSTAKTLAYLLLAPLQLAGSAVKKGDIRGIWGAIESTAIAGRYLLNHFKILSH
jgi:glycosyltransferase involved in cell wall biosynthesis